VRLGVATKAGRAVGTIATIRGRAGANTVRLTGRAGGRRLRAGSYRLTLAVAAQGSGAATVAFTIRR
jgi:hypothetical protein